MYTIREIDAETEKVTHVWFLVESIKEAKKIISMGYNAKISCVDAEPDKKEREKRREYYRWKRMNR